MTLVPATSGGAGAALGLTGATAATRYVGATTGGAPVSGTFAVGDLVVDQTGKEFVCTVAGSPGTWVQVGGSSAIAQVFDSTLGGTQASFDVTGIAATYSHLMMVVNARGTQAANAVNANLIANNDGGANYHVEFTTAAAAVTTSGETLNATAVNVCNMPAASATASYFGSCVVLLPNYASTSVFKSILTLVGLEVHVATTGGMTIFAGSAAHWRSTTAINRLTLTPSAGSWAAGSRVTVYGLT